jgi:NADH-ubiquinone oxidoreductase chain 5
MTGLFVRNFVILYLRFVIRILWLIINNNFYWIIFGWDGLGVVSFLLIIFYMNYERINNGLFTLFQNRIGDLFFVFFMLLIVDLSMWRSLTIKLGLLFLLLGACVKRAQFPFNSWLLSAIRAPTPISSLVHSSTLVVAGVFILLQYRYCLIDFLYVLKFISLLSLIVRSFGLLNEFDIKKLIAYSTISHVSLMIYILSFKLFKVVYFHLNIHAIFKSLIFICFGFVILASYHSQDKRLVSILYINPIIKLVYYFSCICLAGLPFLRGFFSKDFIIEKVIDLNGELIYVCLLLLFLRISIYYRIKLIRLRENIFSYLIIDKSFIGIFRVVFIIVIIVSIINVYINLVFSLRLEVLSFKIRIYFLVLVFLLISIYTNLNFKLFSYDKIKNFRETWLLNVYSLDSFVYWNIYSRVYYFRFLRNVKMFLLINWWVLILVVVFF